MSLIEEIKKEITACDEEIRDCRNELVMLEERLKGYNNKKETLERILFNAEIEQSRTEKTKTTADKPARKSKPKSTPTPAPAITPAAPAPVSKSEEKSESNTQVENSKFADVRDFNKNEPLIISIQELADKLGVPSTAVATSTTRLGIQAEMVDGKFKLTKEQADRIAADIKNKN